MSFNRHTNPVIINFVLGLPVSQYQTLVLFGNTHMSYMWKRKNVDKGYQHNLDMCTFPYLLIIEISLPENRSQNCNWKWHLIKCLPLSGFWGSEVQETWIQYLKWIQLSLHDDPQQRRLEVAECVIFSHSLQYHVVEHFSVNISILFLCM